MGFYIPALYPKDKAKQIQSRYGGVILSRKPQFADIPQHRALIVVVDNGPFEAAGLAFSEDELDAFTREDDERHKEFVLLDKKLAHELTGFDL